MAIEALRASERNVRFLAPESCGRTTIGLEINYHSHKAVPFDQWYFEWNLQKGELTSTSDLWKARFSAFIPLVKGLAFAFVDALEALYVKVMGSKSDCRYCNTGPSRQWQGVKMSARAIYSPNSTRQSFVADTTPLWSKNIKLVHSYS